MFKLSRKKLLVRSFIIFMFAASAITTAALLAIDNHDQYTNAKTGDNTSVHVNGGTKTIHYGDDNLSHTDDYSITNNQGETVSVYCAEASKDWPGDSTSTAEFLSNTDNNKAIKLAIFLDQSNSSAARTAKNIVFDGWSGSADKEYAWTHAIVSAIYAGDYGSLSNSDSSWVNNAITQLNKLVNDNDDAWIMAKRYQLYKADGVGRKQDVVWIESNDIQGAIDIRKCDSATNEECIRQGNANFQGITFEVSYNPTNDNEKIYDSNRGRIYSKGDVITEVTVNADGEARVVLPAGTSATARYLVKETRTNQYYEKTAGQQNASLTSDGQSVTLNFYNDVKTGKIKVNKVDSRTHTCPAQGNASFNGVSFTVINDSSRAIYYGGRKIAKGGDVATKSISGNNCSVTFSDLPIGTYIVKETNAGTGYNIIVATKPAEVNDESTVTLEFENEIVVGNIEVRKIDNKTHSSTPQGDATFNGTTFALKNISEKSIEYEGQIIPTGEVVAVRRLTNNAQTVVFERLPYGKYKIEETEAGIGYTATTSSKEITIQNTGVVTTEFGNDPILGDLTVKIIDEDTGSCVNTRGLTFNNAKFTVKNISKNPVLYNGTSIPSGGTLDVKTYVNDNCSITIPDLPFGTYEVTQTGVTEGYSKDSNTYKPSISTNNLHPSVTLIDKPFRGDVKFVKMDEANNKPMRDVLFSISAIDENYNIIESHIAITNSEGVLDTSSTFALHTNNTHGYDALYDDVNPIFFSGYGTWFGMDELGNPIRTADNEGALPYGKYIIQELKCGSNLFCVGIKDQKSTITINAQNQVIDLHDWNNTCAKFSLETTAVDAKDDDKYIETAKEVKIKDKIDYCVKPNMDFTIKGVLMDKATGEKLLIDGQPVEKTIPINSESDCDRTEMTFTLDASGLGGKEIVVFETLYYKDDVITSHEDINDEAQTVEMVYLHTYATNNLTNEKTLPVDSYTEIKDVVEYCLKPGVEYTFKGALMNKDKIKGIWVDGKPVAQTYTFTPTEACGKFEMIYKLNTKDLDGASLVILENLYRDDELIIQHNDLNNADETVTVDLPEPIPTPNTGLFTNKNNGVSESNNIVFIVGAAVFISVGSYIGMRLVTRKSIFKKKVDF